MKRLFAKIVAIAAACAFFAGAFPQIALALGAPYEYSSTKIDARVETDAALRVDEQRILDYSADASEYVQEIAQLEKNQLIVINDIRVAPVDDEGNVVGEWTRLSSAAFKSAWRNGVPQDELDGLLQTGSYAYDIAKYTVHLYYPAKAGDRLVLNLDYLIVNGALAYKDVGDVHMKYVGEGFIADSHDVTFSLSLPVPEGGKAVADVNVYAWGHGPANGSVDNQGSTIVYTDDYVKAGQYAEAHVVFPTIWLTNITGTDARIHKDDMRLSWVLENEERWQDSFRYGAITDDRISLTISVACVVVLLAGLVIWRRWGRSPKAEVLNGASQRGAKGLRAMHPAMVLRLLNDGLPSDREFAATATRLRDEGFLTISDVRVDLGMRIERRSFELAEDSIDAAAMGVFEALAGDSQVVDLGDISGLQERRQLVLAAVRVWDDETAAAYQTLGYNDPVSSKWAHRLRKVSLLLLLAVLFVVVATTCYLAAAILMLASLGVLAISCEMKALTQEAVDVSACFDAYRDELETFDNLTADQRFDAYLLGLPHADEPSDEVAFAEGIEDAIPRVFRQIHRSSTNCFGRISARIKRIFVGVKQKSKKNQATNAA